MTMFCFQCQECANNKGCTVRGVCGKTDDVANLQDLLIYLIKGISIYSLKAKEQDPTPRTRAIVIYPMNALANSQREELAKFVVDYPEGKAPFSVARYTGQETQTERSALSESPPDILLTNFMMLELILTRQEVTDRKVVENCKGLQFLVLDELHTYRGRQGADVAMLVRRLRQRTSATALTCVGTSATMSNTGSESDKLDTVSEVASKLFGTEITRDDV
ncbi:MAG: DEAD/DEAH box helicase, partial [Synergistales bacterium]|nr:DEAD/DEAH box helicase [Synergistales bacterium]